MATLFFQPIDFHSSLQIMGTFIYHGSSIFWRNVKDYASLHGNEVVCWKFLVILLRIIQDGQANAVRDSLEQLEFIGQYNIFLLHHHFSFNSEVKMCFFLIFRSSVEVSSKLTFRVGLVRPALRGVGTVDHDETVFP